MSSCLSPFSIFLYLFGNDVGLDCKVLLSSWDAMPHLGIKEYLIIFFWTCLLETPFYLSLIWWGGIRWQKAVGLILLANILTHPLITFGFPFFFQGIHVPLVTSSLYKETFALAAEVLITRKFAQVKWRQAISVAGLANFFSWWVGSLISESWFWFGL